MVEHCAADGRALLTDNVADFVGLARQWGVEARSHPGLVFTSDAALPRSRRTIGRSVELLDRLLADHPADDGFVDRVRWLG